MAPHHKQPSGLAPRKAVEEDVITVEALDSGMPAASINGDTAASEVGSAVQRERSIYDTFSVRRRYALLGLMSFAAFLVPFSGECCWRLNARLLHV